MTIAPGVTVPFVEQDWLDALVVVERGDVDLCCTRGGRRRFVQGSMLVLQGLALRSLHNPGVEEVVLVAMSRRSPTRPDDPERPCPDDEVAS